SSTPAVRSVPVSLSVPAVGAAMKAPWSPGLSGIASFPQILVTRRSRRHWTKVVPQRGSELDSGGADVLTFVQRTGGLSGQGDRCVTGRGWLLPAACCSPRNLRARRHRTDRRPEASSVHAPP